MEMKFEMRKIIFGFPGGSKCVRYFTQASSFNKRQPKTPGFSAFFLMAETENFCLPNGRLIQKHRLCWFCGLLQKKQEPITAGFPVSYRLCVYASGSLIMS